MIAGTKESGTVITGPDHAEVARDVEASGNNEAVSGYLGGGDFLRSRGMAVADLLVWVRTAGVIAC